MGVATIGKPWKSRTRASIATQNLSLDRALEIVDRLTTERSEALDKQYRALADCLGKLHPRDRDLIERRYRVGATPKSVGQQVGRSVAAVYKALSRIHDALFDCIQKATAMEGGS